ncbi:uncharacterized protein [Typha latifolia]|uniref:uncharacterized protein n=1 Tax=Typha latifolia TaxID=4733 RepID=UPI003C2D245E
MKSSPIFPGDGNWNETGYDLQLDFAKFLQEARKHANDVKLSSLPSNSVQDTAAGAEGAKKKSWKRYLSFWFKFQNNKSRMQQHKTSQTKSSTGSCPRNPRRGPVSGPIFGNGGRLAQIHHSIKRTASGPLAGCFTPTRAEESAVPYMYLDKQSHAIDRQAFGPIYLVT